MKVSDVLNSRVRVLLRDTDEGGILWSDNELITWLNEACLEVTRVRPAASSDTFELTPVAGALQSLPANAIMLLEIPANMVGGTVGRVVRRVERNDLDNEMPNWRFSTPTNSVMRYSVSKTDVKTFHVYPPSVGGATAGLMVVASVLPTVVGDLVDEFPIEDIYAAPVANYILYRAFLKQLESPAAQQRAGEFLQLFNAQMGITDQTLETRSAEQRQAIPR